MKATAIAPSNIAFIKYWGKKDEGLRLPENGSISMNLSNLLTTSTVEFDPKLKNDEIMLNEEKQPIENRASKHLDRIREIAEISSYAKVVTNNNFPTSTGLSSSASGFAALTVASTTAAGLKLSEKELSILARLGSGSACRSIPDGFVEWLDGNTNETSYAVSLFQPDYWEIVDIIAIVNVGPKNIPTSEGQKSAKSSPFFLTRLEKIQDKIMEIKRYLQQKDFKSFGELIESEALELHAIMLTATPGLIYWLPGTISVMRQVQKLRRVGLQVYFTVNTGQDIHLICQKKDAKRVSELVKGIPEVRDIIINLPAKGAHLSSHHLF
jgi:diphosphomevalonate decarboxylase